MENNFIHKFLLLLLLSVLYGCKSPETLLTEQFSGEKIYVCHKQPTLTLGEKTIQYIEKPAINHYQMLVLNSRGHQETINYTLNSNNYIAENKNMLTQAPFCSQSEYIALQNKLKKEKALARDKLKKQKEKERQEANKAKLIAQNADCKQAIEKAKHRADEINAKNLFVLDESKTSTQPNHTGNWSFCLKVIDYDNAGIIVQSGCTASPLVNMFLDSTIGCEYKYYFIYTTDAYADRECYKNWEYFHEDAGVYTWKYAWTNKRRIRAFKTTNFKISETDYHTYLRDKDINCCIHNDNVSVCE